MTVRKRRDTWIAHMYYKQTSLYVGTFPSKEEAECAIEKKKSEVYGEKPSEKEYFPTSLLVKETNRSSVYHWIKKNTIPLISWKGRHYIHCTDVERYREYVSVNKEESGISQMDLDFRKKGYYPIGALAKRVGITRQALLNRARKEGFPVVCIGERRVYATEAMIENSLALHAKTVKRKSVSLPLEERKQDFL